MDDKTLGSMLATFLERVKLNNLKTKNFCLVVGPIFFSIGNKPIESKRMDLFTEREINKTFCINNCTLSTISVTIIINIAELCHSCRSN